MTRVVATLSRPRWSAREGASISIKPLERMAHSAGVGGHPRGSSACGPPLTGSVRRREDTRSNESEATHSVGPISIAISKSSWASRRGRLMPLIKDTRTMLSALL